MYVQWGTACEYSNYDSTNRTVTDVAHRASKHIVVDPRVTPLGKEADIWLPLRPGTDGALALSWLNWVIENEAYDDTMVRRWSNASFLYVDDKPELTEGWLVEGNGGINMKTKLLTEADLKEDGKYQRFIVWDEANERLTYWDAELGKWEGEEHRIPTTGTWIEHPYKPLVADAWLPDQSTFADPATEPDRFPDGSDACNPKGLPKRPALLPGEVEVTLKDGSVHKACAPGRRASTRCTATAASTSSWPPTRTETPSRTCVRCRSCRASPATPTSRQATADLQRLSSTATPVAPICS